MMLISLDNKNTLNFSIFYRLEVISYYKTLDGRVQLEQC